MSWIVRPSNVSLRYEKLQEWSKMARAQVQIAVAVAIHNLPIPRLTQIVN